MLTASKLALAAGLAMIGAAFSTPSLAGPIPAAEMKSAGQDIQPLTIAHRPSHKPRRKARTRVHVTPGYARPAYVYPYGYPGPGSGYAFNPARVGPGGAYQGNVPGCAVDLGYGRYESCDMLR